MNRLCWRAAPLACALFSGGLVLAQFPDYVETSRYGYNPLTGTTVQSRGYYNSFTGAGARTFSVTNPYTGAAMGGMAVNPYTGSPDAYGAVDERALRNFSSVDPVLADAGLVGNGLGFGDPSVTTTLANQNGFRRVFIGGKFTF